MEKNIVVLCFLLLICIVASINCLEIKQSTEKFENLFAPPKETYFRANYDSVQNESAISIKKRFVDLRKILDLWNPTLLIDVWKKDRDFKISSRCDQDFSAFLSGLESSTNWALQSE